MGSRSDPPSIPADFEALVAAAQACRRCPSMKGRRRVLSVANGRPGARVLFVGEAPGRFGAERTGVPFSGDQSGRRFEALLAAAGLTREQVFVTNVVLCNPLGSDGCNRPPSLQELRNCRPYLAATLRVVDPQLVVALGQRALDALAGLHPHRLSLRGQVGLPVVWLDGRSLVALYHPSPQAGVHRPWERQVEDWRRALSALERGRSPEDRTER